LSAGLGPPPPQAASNSANATRRMKNQRSVDERIEGFNADA
jgi:hypothetical protein